MISLINILWHVWSSKTNYLILCRSSAVVIFMVQGLFYPTGDNNNNNNIDHRQEISGGKLTHEGCRCRYPLPPGPSYVESSPWLKQHRALLLLVCDICSMPTESSRNGGAATNSMNIQHSVSLFNIAVKRLNKQNLHPLQRGSDTHTQLRSWH